MTHRSQPDRGSPSVFVSYSHKDEAWKDRLVAHLRALGGRRQLNIWDDRRIAPGEDWYHELQAELDAAKVAILLISPDFLSSSFIYREELPRLLEQAQKEGLRVIPVILRSTVWRDLPWLSRLQVLPVDGRPLSTLSPDQRDATLTEIAHRAFDILSGAQSVSPPEPVIDSDKISLNRLPITDLLIGREKELTFLHNSWNDPQVNIVSLVGWAGLGKTALVNYWLDQLVSQGLPQGSRVFAWSFNTIPVAESFTYEALSWFGDPDPTAGSPWDRGNRLAMLVQKERNILVLDGLEPLQSDLEFEKGRLVDPAISQLVENIAIHNTGLCIITSRQSLVGLDEFPHACKQLSLEQLSPKAGRMLLRSAGVRGTDGQLARLGEALSNNALLIRLVGGYLNNISDADVSAIWKIIDQVRSNGDASRSHQIFQHFFRLIGEGTEVQLLRILALFEQRVTLREISPLRSPPRIANLNEKLLNLTEEAFHGLAAKLKRWSLLATSKGDSEDVLDMHPIIRECIAEDLQKQYAAAWREGHNRLFEHLKDAAQELPDTIDEMGVLFRAVAHGCKAERYEEALRAVYWPRVLRGHSNYAVSVLGAVSANMAALQHFFAHPWTTPVPTLSSSAKAFVLNAAGFSLRASGRLRESVGPTQAGLQLDLEQGLSENAIVAASNLSELHLSLGDLETAVREARASVEIANSLPPSQARVWATSVLATCLHQLGQASKAADAFRQAEALQGELQPEFPLLYSISGFRYCDLLLDMQQHEAVATRALTTLEWARSHGSLLPVALDQLTLARCNAHRFLEGASEDPTDAFWFADRAVDALRRLGLGEYISMALIIRALLHRIVADLDRARWDLEEALRIARRSSMSLMIVDASIECARLAVLSGDPEKARQYVHSARSLIESTKYNRKVREIAMVEELWRA